MDVVATRKSIRDYADKPVEDEKLSKMFEAARMAPSWANKQCCQYVMVKNKDKIAELSSFLIPWLKKVPVVVAACANPKESGSRNGMDYYLVDVAISMQQLVLAATDLGLGTCWLGAFDEAKVKKTLEIPDNIKVVALTPVGYAADPGLRSKIIRKVAGSEKRKAIEEIVHMEKW